MSAEAYYRQMQEYYDGAKYNYDFDSLRKQIRDETPQFGILEPVLDTARRLFDGKRILDLGCGIGRWCRALSPVAAHMTGVDFCPRLTEIAREGTLAKNVTFVTDDVLKLTNVRGKFEGAVHWNVFNHIPWRDWTRFIDVLHAQLVPGAPVVMGAQQLLAKRRRELLTWTDLVHDPVQHNPVGEKVYYVVEHTFDEALVREVFGHRVDDLQATVFPPPEGRTVGAWSATYRVPG